jgi:hypothetical protein
MFRDPGSPSSKLRRWLNLDVENELRYLGPWMLYIERTQFYMFGENILYRWIEDYEEELQNWSGADTQAASLPELLLNMKKSGSPKNTRILITENLRRRRNTIMKNTDKLCRDFGCEGYVLLKRNGKFFTYTSSNRSGWPASIAEVVSSLL